jgi:hypothetical protein
MARALRLNPLQVTFDTNHREMSKSVRQNDFGRMRSVYHNEKNVIFTTNARSVGTDVGDRSRASLWTAVGNVEMEMQREPPVSQISEPAKAKAADAKKGLAVRVQFRAAETSQP